MRLKSLLFLIPIAFVLYFSTSSAETIDLTVTFSQNDLSFAVRDGYDQVTLRGADLMRQTGRPQLPVVIARAVIPPGHRVRGVEIVGMDLIDLPGRYDIFPAQPPQILSLMETELDKISFVEPEVSVYRSREPFPDRAVLVTGDGYLAGHHLADLEIRPLIYLPAERRLRLIENLSFRLLTEPGGRGARSVGQRSARDRQFYQNLLGKIVLNPADADRMSPRGGATSAKTLPPGEHEYVIVTMNNYTDEFQPLADWKGQKGVPDTIVTREWIESNYSGYDVPEKIRNFIVDAYQSWGTRWVLLGGDTDVVPARIAYAMTCEANHHPDEDDIRADLYFSDLDGTWDANGNHTYGEVADSIDLYPDVFVGRASVSSQSEAQAWVSKMLLYERTPQPDHPLRMLFLAEILWKLVPMYTDGAVHKDMIDDESVPARFDPITKLYESLGNESADSARHHMNLGQNLINHDGHCWYDIMSMGTGSLNRSDMDNLTNSAYPSIMYSIGCWPAAFDFDCMAEHWTNNPNGGGVAFVGNSRYGWGAPRNPGYGYSDIFDNRFFHELFIAGQTHIGAALAAAKAHYAPKSRQENVYRIHQYQVNLLGDPEMPIWTDTPGTLTVDGPEQVPPGPVGFEVTVKDGQDPVAGAMVCVTGDGGLYVRDLTGLTGQVLLNATVPMTDSLQVTVAARDYYPHTSSIPVMLSGPYVAKETYSVDDASGNDNGEINPGEVIDVGIVLKNSGLQTASSVSAVLRSQHPMMAVIDSVGMYGDLNPGDTARSDYLLSFSGDCQDGQVFYLELEIQDASLNSWSSTLGLVTVEPYLAIVGGLVNDGNDEVPQPGDTLAVDVILKNEGLGMAAGVTAQVSALDKYAAVLIDTAAYGDIPPDTAIAPTTSYLLAVSDSCPAHHDLPLMMEVFTADAHVFVEGLSVAIGERGFADDMESGAGGWTHGGTKDHWHLSTQRCHSASTSWYCGIEDSLEYEKNMNAYLISEPFIPGPQSKLIFWVWYDMPIYGADGLYVVVGYGDDWDTLDYFGTGGALDSLYMGNDWLPYEYDLSAYDTVQVKFIFRSDYDSDVDEGMYIDDVTVTGARMMPEDVLPPSAVVNLTVTLADTALALDWSPSYDDGGVDHYVIYRDTLWTFQPASSNSLAATPDTSYLDVSPGLTSNPKRSYYYLVRAVDVRGNRSVASGRVGEFDRTMKAGSEEAK